MCSLLYFYTERMCKKKNMVEIHSKYSQNLQQNGRHFVSVSTVLNQKILWNFLKISMKKFANQFFVYNSYPDYGINLQSWTNTATQ
jgi:hypothetical protein